MRLFVAIPLEDPARSRVLEVREAIAKLIARQGVRFVGPEKLHLTLAFLGDVALEHVGDLTARLDALSALPRLQLELAGIGAFPDLRRPKVIWVGLVGDVASAASLAEAVASAARPLSPQLDEKPFAAHITLARVKPGSKEVGRVLQALNLRIPRESLPVASFSLIHSRPDGIYETLHTVHLQG